MGVRCTNATEIELELGFQLPWDSWKTLPESRGMKNSKQRAGEPREGMAVSSTDPEGESCSGDSAVPGAQQCVPSLTGSHVFER